LYAYFTKEVSVLLEGLLQRVWDVDVGEMNDLAYLQTI
jgi:hypothetical protein